MRKILVFVIGVMVLLGGIMPLYASTNCATKYPIVLVHGIGNTDKSLLGINYFWGIPAALRKEGATVYVSNQDPYNGETIRATKLAQELGEQFAINPTWTKINIIAHSLGGLDSRNVIANYNIPGKGPAKNYIASMTSISGTHKGSQMADLLWGLYTGIPVVGNFVGNMIGDAFNAVTGLIFYDTSKPNTMLMIHDLTSDFTINTFNPNAPDQPGVMYQSWGGKINYIGFTTIDQLWVGPLWLAMKAMGSGDNDMLVSLDSAKWGTWRGAITTSWLFPGVNHLYEIDQLFGITPYFDAKGFYVSVVKDLKAKGY